MEPEATPAAADTGAVTPPAPTACRECGTEIPPGWLDCPSCRRLVHSEELKGLATEADRARASGNLGDALRAWRRALELLPPDSAQHRKVSERLDVLSAELEASGEGSAPDSGMPEKLRARLSKYGGAAVAAGVLVWKLKFVLTLVLTKGKLLLLGLTKTTTLLSMFLSLGLYWSIWGWKFAVGIVGSIYVHEMGHVAALRRLGIKAGAPMFIPGLGAAVRLKQYPASAREDARVGLAGPIWGLGAAVATYAAFLLTGWTSLAAIARVAAWINLFNLLPVWQLDGSRGFRALSRPGRWLCVAAMAVLWAYTQEGLYALLGIVAGIRALSGDASARSDRRTLTEFLLLLAALGLLCAIEVPGLADGLAAS